MDEKEKSDPWDLQDDEKVTWFERFARYYLVQGRRTVVGAQRRCAVAEGRRRPKKLAGSWARAAKTWNWEKRGTAWAIETVRREREVFSEAKKSVAKEAFNAYRNLMRKASKDLFTPEDDSAFSQTNAVRAIEVAAKGLLLISGHATESIHSTGEVSASLKIDPEDIPALLTGEYSASVEKILATWRTMDDGAEQSGPDGLDSGDAEDGPSAPGVGGDGPPKSVYSP